MKKYLSLLLLLSIFAMLMVIPASADAPAFTNKLVGTVDTTVKFNEKNTFIVDWQVMSNRPSITLNANQGLRLAFDNEVLQMIAWDASIAIPDSVLKTNNLTFFIDMGLGDKDMIKSAVFPFNFLCQFFASKNDTGQVGYMSWLLGMNGFTYPCPQDSYVSFGQVRFAFRDGFSESDLNPGSVRLLTALELYDISQTDSITITTNESGNTAYRYGNQFEGKFTGLDELEPPIIEYPGSNPAIISVRVSGLVAPVTGATPIGAGALATSDKGYGISSITWSPSHTIFAPGTSYSAQIVLKTDSSYKFEGSITPLVNVGTVSSPGIIGGGDVLGNTLTFTVNFPPTPSNYAFSATAGTGGSISGTPSGDYEAGTAISVTATADSGYHFTGWTVLGVTISTIDNPAVFNMPENAVTLTANFAKNTYTITASAGANGKIAPNGDVTVLQGENQTFIFTPDVGYEVDTVTVDGGTVSVAENFTFVSVSNDHTIHVTFKAKIFDVIWIDGDGNVLLAEKYSYGATPVYSGATPTKAATAQYTYTFNSTWSPAIVAVVADATYTAQFDSTLRQYNVTWLDGDGNELSVVSYDYGATPVYSGVTPTKTATAQYTYTFNTTWTPTIVAVVADATYTAQFDSSVRKYNVTWLDGDDNVLLVAEYSYGDTPVYTGATPTKTKTSELVYTFNGAWSPAIVAVVANATYTAQFDSKVSQYEITWLDGDGNVLSVVGYEYGATPVYSGVTPTKAATAQYTYTFNNTWFPAIVAVVADATYTAQFDSTVRKYNITWLDGDGKELSVVEFNYGATPVYSGVTPTKTATAQYTYTFNNTWSPSIIPVVADATYSAQFDSTVRKYNVTWLDGDGKELSVAEYNYGATPVYSGVTPTKAATAQYTYTFNNTWSPAIVAVVADATYTAQFDSAVRKYNVTWLDGDNNVLSIVEYNYGDIPVYSGATPTKARTSELIYTFNGAWSPTIVAVVANATYTAQFDSETSKYEITWLDGDGNVLLVTGYDYGVVPVYSGATPTKATTAQYTYTFNGAWSPAVVAVVADATYTAQFDSTVRKYNLTWLDGDDNILSVVAYDYGSLPVYSGATPTKTATAQYTYTFNNTWSPAIVAVVADATYTAQFDSVLRSYTVIFDSTGGSAVASQNVSYGDKAQKPTDPYRSDYDFAGWYTDPGCTDGNLYDFDTLVTSSFTVYAKWTPVVITTYPLTIIAGTGGSVGGTPSGSYEEGKDISVTATANSGYHFTGWTAVGVTLSSNMANPATFKMPANAVTLTANFAKDTFTLSVIAGSGGSVSGTSGGDYEEGMPIIVTAIADSGYHFTGWTAIGVTLSSNMANPAVFSMPANAVTLTANFELDIIPTYSFTAISWAGGSISGTSSGDYEVGTPISVTAKADSGYRFTGWTVNGVAISTTANPATFNMPANAVSLAANFEPVGDEPVIIIGGNSFLTGWPVPTTTIYVPIKFSCEDNIFELLSAGYSFTIKYDTTMLKFVGPVIDGSKMLLMNEHPLDPPGTIRVVCTPMGGLNLIGYEVLVPFIVIGTPDFTDITTLKLDVAKVILEDPLDGDYKNVETRDVSVKFFEIIMGDINGDGLVTPEDAMLLLQMYVGLIPWTEQALLAGDVNGDGVVDTTDAALILRMVVGG